MAVTLTEAEKLDIAKILGLTYIDVNDKVTDLGESYVTAAVEADIRELITEWETARDEYQSIEPKDRNFGVRYDPSAKKNTIRTELANLLYFTNLQPSGQNWGRSTRG
jgi:hypothetical protein